MTHGEARRLLTGLAKHGHVEQEERTYCGRVTLYFRRKE